MSRITLNNMTTSHTRRTPISQLAGWNAAAVLAAGLTACGTSSSHDVTASSQIATTPSTIDTALTASTRVCSYDKFGTGTSDPAPDPQRFSTQATDLHELLRPLHPNRPARPRRRADHVAARLERPATTSTTTELNGGQMNTEASNRQRLITAWAQERHASTEASQRHDLPKSWAHLERAHIISQPMAGRHVRTHLAMLRFAVRTLRPHEVVGQLFRTLVAAPGTWSGRYPAGNTGGANVSAFAAMAIPADLQRLLASNFEDAQ